MAACVASTSAEGAPSDRSSSANLGLAHFRAPFTTLQKVPVAQSSSLVHWSFAD
jgi:hypothetical protein